VVDTVDDLLPPILRAVRGSQDNHDRLIRNVNQMRPVLGNTDTRAVDLAVAAIYSSVLDFDRTTERLLTRLRKQLDPHWQQTEHDFIAGLLERGHSLEELPPDVDRRLADWLALRLDLIPERQASSSDRLWLISDGGLKPWRRPGAEKTSMQSKPASWWGTEVAQRMDAVRGILRSPLEEGIRGYLRGRREAVGGESGIVVTAPLPDVNRMGVRRAINPNS
jgi:hypothetical protein